jgi:hypothetical protein
MINYEQASKLVRSEKISLVTCEAVKQVKIFQLYSGATYSKVVPHFVSNVLQNGVELEIAPDKDSLTSGTWFFDAKNKTVYVNIVGDADPKTDNVSVVYKFFFSNTPINLPYDLSNGEVVEWLPLIGSIGSIGQTLDDQNTGIVLESQSSVEFINDGFFDSIFDSLIWDNQNINFYSWFNGIELSEAKRIFTGVIESKDFSQNKISFKVKDYVYKLKNQVNLGLFSELDGTVLDSVIGTPKRRIYGQVRQVQTVPIDCIKDGYNLTGLITINAGATLISGSGTQFRKELSPGDEIKFIVNNEEIKFTIDTITSDTVASIARNSETTINNLACTVRPERPYRFKNRRWHLAGHKIRSSEAIIETVINSRQFVVDDPSEFFPNDIVVINGITTQVTRVSGLQIILEQSIFPIPSAGDSIVKQPVTGVYFGENELIINRDFTLTNTTEAIIELDELAEFNIAKERLSSVQLVFSSGSATVNALSGSVIDLRTLIKPRDWIRKLTQSTIEWYEVLSVTELSLTLRLPYTNASFGTEKALIKNVDLVNDESLITVDCYGYDSNKWVKTASDCVKHLIQNDAGFSNVNADSFTQANADCSYKISMVIPEDIGQEAPMIRDVITKINESVFGSLYGDSSQNLSYSIVNTRRPTTLKELHDDDVISWDVSSNQQIVNKVKINYSPFVDKITGDNGFNVVTYTNEFVDNNVRIKNTIEKTCYLFEEQDATTIAQRYAFYNSLSQSVISIKAKADFFTSSVNDRVYVNFDRLYNRYGESSRRKIGVISSIKKSAYESEVSMNDLGNIFNRCHTLAESTTAPFTSATDDEKIKYGFILDPDTLTPDPTSEEDLGSHLIG